MTHSFNAEREFAFHHADFENVRQRLKSLAGISLADSKDSMVYSRLARRIRALKLNSFAQYLQRLDHDSAEIEYFVNALTTNLTSFFRESHHFDVLKQFLQERREPLRIWCAAASSGEEPYSIAMACAEARGSFKHNIDIIASDIDSNVLQKARSAVYPITAVQKVAKKRKESFFLRGKGKRSGMVKLIPEIQKSVTYFQQNLLDTKWQLDAPVDVVFCRNVMIYFDRPTQDRLIRQFIQHMNPNSMYIAGHSENFTSLPKELKLLGQTVYRCKGA